MRLRQQIRSFAWQAASATNRGLNNPIDFSKTPLLHHNRLTFPKTPGLPTDGKSTRMNLIQVINNGLETALNACTEYCASASISCLVVYFGVRVGYR